jgi:hypothetical protein
MMMKMLEAGGLPVVTDNIRTADEDNPKGYYELEAVKRTKQDPTWREAAAGKTVKLIAQLLYDLPLDGAYRYKVVFMRRNLDEMLASQKKMLERRGEPDDTPDGDMKEMFVQHLEEVELWLRGIPHMDVLFVNYNRMVAEPDSQLDRVARFLDAGVDVAAMKSVIDPELYRQRR